MGKMTPLKKPHDAQMAAGTDVPWNVIPLNPTAGYDGSPSDPVRVQAFIDILERGGILATIRVRRGIDIDAGCGQLKSKEWLKPIQPPLMCLKVPI